MLNESIEDMILNFFSSTESMASLIHRIKGKLAEKPIVVTGKQLQEMYEFAGGNTYQCPLTAKEKETSYPMLAKGHAFSIKALISSDSPMYCHESPKENLLPPLGEDDEH